MLKRIPALLVTLRVLLAPALLWLILNRSLRLAAAAYTLAVLSDIYDGVIARKLGVSTRRLRLADGLADIWLYVWLGSGLITGFHGLLAPVKTPFWLAIGLQVLSWLFCFWRFGKLTSYHSFLAKLTGLCLLVGILALLLAQTPLPLAVALWVFVANLLEEIAITALLPTYHHDVWNLAEARRLRRKNGA